MRHDGREPAGVWSPDRECRRFASCADGLPHETEPRTSRFVVLLALLVVLSVYGIKNAEAGSADELNRTAVNYIGEWVMWGDFNVGFKADRARFSVKNHIIQVRLSGTFSDERKEAGQETDMDDVEIPLRLEYQIDSSRLDPEVGITTADTSGIIELHCSREQQCVRLKAEHEGRDFALRSGMVPGVLAGFGPARHGVPGVDEGVSNDGVLDALHRLANRLRTAAGLPPVGN